ncbi:MAG TPA: rRNA maturation RNase YbeY [Gammaproteobacteria bacterium]|nr:rRNA maturation RNase YbeY [Acidiferrobacteraceae bacterium]MDP6551921.1 rRNA maturation RNase YbeY [Arenicellales bacterium]MDP6791354.1 rRNA maturation RNase YbeY [Arenicellales bacterium]MDP6919325.1 rRNA maturation RNase YbeY [Arenicellales bacterium]HCX87297.1 rRNA maturation RNase YbeY [Gammaproteobacteria bacterium]
MEPRIAVQLASGHRDEPTVEQIRNWAGAALAALQDDRACLTVRMVNETEMTDLNARFRGRQGPTNVLSFPFEALPGLPQDKHPLGDIVVCPPVVAREALSQGKKIEHHVAHLLVHGVLHLHGHDHHSDRQAEAMEKLETQVLATLGIKDPYRSV